MNTVRVATYNIHKGVQGVGPRRRLEIHNLGLAIEQFDADVVCLQEVRKLHRGEASYFTDILDCVTCVTNGLRSGAGGDQLNTGSTECAGEVQQTGLVADRDQGATNGNNVAVVVEAGVV